MDFAIDIGIWGLAALILGALLIGLVAQLIGQARFGYEWVITSIAAFVGGLGASEWITSWRTFEPVWDKLAIVPAVIGALVVGIVVDVIVRYLSHGSYTRQVEA